LIKLFFLNLGNNEISKYLRVSRKQTLAYLLGEDFRVGELLFPKTRILLLQKKAFQKKRRVLWVSMASDHGEMDLGYGSAGGESEQEGGVTKSNNKSEQSKDTWMTDDHSFGDFFMCCL
jgi:hypothetical protein